MVTMSYAICNIVYGIQMGDPLQVLMVDMEIEAEAIGCTRLYSGSGDDPIYCGKELGTFSEGGTMKAANLLPKLSPSGPALMKLKGEVSHMIEVAKKKFLDILDGADGNHNPDEYDPEAVAQIADEKEAVIKFFDTTKPEVLLIWSSS